MEDPIDAVQRARCRCVWLGGAHALAPMCALQPQAPYKPLHRAARHANAFAVELQPGLVGPVSIAVAVDIGLRDLSRRSSSACAKNALAVFRMSLARRSPLTSRSSSLMCWASDVVVTRRCPLSTSTFLTQPLRICGTQPIWGAIDSMAAHSEG